MSGNLPIKRQDENTEPRLGSPTKKTKVEIIDAKQNGNFQEKQQSTQNSDEESVLLSDESDSTPNIKIKILKNPKPKTPSSEESYSDAEQPSEESQISDEDYIESESQESESEESWDEPPRKGKRQGRKRYSSDSDY
ncbi:unnamed protein product [Blepharisma stoltei]|uniref:Uncharacterized protein n=1 Tax=Blepharisma stoltei TaxID=1481888 RepID=A0AAU9JW50_9CILI|nr:unnamed protein product [Blepharisma stoltei]